MRLYSGNEPKTIAIFVSDFIYSIYCIYEKGHGNIGSLECESEVCALSTSAKQDR